MAARSGEAGEGLRRKPDAHRGHTQSCPSTYPAKRRVFPENLAPPIATAEAMATGFPRVGLTRELGTSGPSIGLYQQSSGVTGLITTYDADPEPQAWHMLACVLLRQKTLVLPPFLF